MRPPRAPHAPGRPRSAPARRRRCARIEPSRRTGICRRRFVDFSWTDWRPMQPCMMHGMRLANPLHLPLRVWAPWMRSDASSSWVGVGHGWLGCMQPRHLARRACPGVWLPRVAAVGVVATVRFPLRQPHQPAQRQNAAADPPQRPCRKPPLLGGPLRWAGAATAPQGAGAGARCSCSCFVVAAARSRAAGGGRTEALPRSHPARDQPSGSVCGGCRRSVQPEPQAPPRTLLLPASQHSALRRLNTRTRHSPLVRSSISRVLRADAARRRREAAAGRGAVVERPRLSHGARLGRGPGAPVRRCRLSFVVCCCRLAKSVTNTSRSPPLPDTTRMR